MGELQQCRPATSAWNTELVKKPKDLLEYVVVHEMAHLIEPTHSDRFIAILDARYPTWRDARVELNDLSACGWRLAGVARMRWGGRLALIPALA